MTKKGADLYREWRVEQVKRDAEAFDVLTYTDYSGYDIDDSETNARRVMLIGTATLTAIDRLVDAGMFNNDSELRNIGFMLGLLLQFAVDFEEACQTHENDWRFNVVDKADKHGIIICGLYSCTTELLVSTIRSDMDDKDESELEEQERDLEDENVERVDERPNFVRAYDPAPYNPAPPNGVPELGVSRSWAAWDWKQELAAYSKLRGVDGKIGGDHYDLTAEHNQDSSSSEDSADFGCERKEAVPMPRKSEAAS